MLGSDSLEVAVGVVFVFVLVSTICSAIREGIEAWLKTRAAFLEFGIRELLRDKNGTGLTKQLFEHPLVFSLFNGDYKPQKLGNKPPKQGGNLPSYIPSRNFALALMDIAAQGPKQPLEGQRPGALSVSALRAAIEKNVDLPIRPALLALIDAAGDDLDRARVNIETWYDSTMDRVSGWYKRSTLWFIFWIALGIAAVLNINTLAIIDYLSRHDAERSVLIATIENTSAEKVTSYEDAMSSLDALRLPIGWGEKPKQERVESGSTGNIGSNKGDDVSWVWLEAALGWLLTAVAATLGAPFWFDVLNKIMVIRSTVKPHEKSPEEGSEDRQAGRAPRVERTS
jgi:hypothetical protein